MSVYVGIDVHRKRSQVAVVAGDGKVQVNRNVVNGSEPMLRLISGLPPGTPVAFEAAYGWGWLVELLEDYGAGPETRPDAGWVLARPLRQPRPGTTTRPPQKPARKDPSPLPMIPRRPSASSSFVLAAARLRALQLDPSRTAM